MLALENGILGLLQPCRQFLAVQILGRGYVHAEAVAQCDQRKGHFFLGSHFACALCAST